MISGSASSFPNASQGMQMYSVAAEDIVSSSLEAPVGSGPEAHSSSLLYHLSILKDKVHQVQSLVSILISPADHQTHPESTSLALANMGSLVQEIIVAASSMIYVCQQMSTLGTSTSSGNNNSTTEHLHQQQQIRINLPDDGIAQTQQPNFSDNYVVNVVQERGQGFYSSTHDHQTISWYGDQYCNNLSNKNSNSNRSLEVRSNKDDKLELAELSRRSEIGEGSTGNISANNCDIIELDAAALLAKYTHYCQVCGKGFKRDANLRMHMRAHGDEYKTTAALTNPTKNHHEGSMGNCPMKLMPKKYSCPQEGCRWNQKHAKFQPLKSMICVKNHYKRSHCPKMYVCNRCNRKQFSVLSDLRTHEKHCGDVKWQCSCGTTFSRKDKLMGHVALFVGHIPAVLSLTKPGKLEHQDTAMQLDDRDEK